MQLQQPSTSSYRKRQHYDRTTMKVFNETKEIHYTTHHNWSWVVKHALEKLIKIEGQPNATKLCFCERFRELPSTQSEQSKEKPLYALFRLDLTWNIGPKLTKVRTKSDIFGFLDPKDSLTRMAQLSGAINCMPSTLLIPWNWLTSSAVSLGKIDNSQYVFTRHFSL